MIKELNYNVTGSDRKALVGIISRETGIKAAYKGMPSMAYEIGPFTVDREGTVTWEDGTDAEIIRKLATALVEDGFEAEEDSDSGVAYSGEDLTAAEMSGLTISLPMDGFNQGSLDRLQKLVDSKASLIRKATAADSLTIRITGDKVELPWWGRLPEPAETQAYMGFIAALCAKAKEARRVNAKEREVESEKFAFRVFLLNLGFKGSDSKQIRNVLLKRLSGSAAFPTQAAADGFSAKQKAKRDAAKAQRAENTLN